MVRNMSAPAVLSRLRTHVECPDGWRPYFTIRGRLVPVAEAGDVALPIRERRDVHGLPFDVRPRCPDCGGDGIVWAENGRVPGARKCMACGSLFSDSRYGP